MCSRVLDITQILDQLQEYQHDMGYCFKTMTPEERMEAMRNYVLALQMEQAELMERLPWKPWKNESKEFKLTEHIINEWTDCLVFLMDQALCLGITGQDVARSYAYTLRKLYDRIESGYNTKRQKEKTL